jgi:hypothetical protein
MAGIIIAIVTWKRNPRPSLLAILAIVFMLVFDLIAILLNIMPVRLTEQCYTMFRIGMLLSVANLALAILKAGGYVLLLAEIFSGRRTLPTCGSLLAASE